MEILFKVTAHFGSRIDDYYVIADDSAKAVNMVREFHNNQGYINVDFCHIETIAQGCDYGKPSILLNQYETK